MRESLTPEEMESRIVTNFERAITFNVVGIEHIESQPHQSIAVVRVYFHPTVQVDLALSQIVTQCQVQVRNMPPGAFPPQVLKYMAHGDNRQEREHQRACSNSIGTNREVGRQSRERFVT